jgi:lysophospholipase L1-like esterase
MSPVARIATFLPLTAVMCLLAGCRHSIPNPELLPGDLTVLCAGDSITAGTHGAGDTGAESYPSLLASKLQQYRSDIQVVNEGQDGWTVTDVSQHIDNWLEPVSPHILLLQIGTNDLEQGVSPEDAASRLDLLITQIQSLSPDTHLYVASTTPMRADNKPGLDLATLAQFNGYIPYIVHEHEKKHRFIVFVDLFKRSGMTNTDFGPDGEHPDDAGYEKMADFWFRTLLKRESTELHETNTTEGEPD